MKPYFSLLRVRFLNGIQYRAAALGGLATQFFWGIMLVFIYKAFYGDSVSANGFLYKDLVSFVWLQQAFLSFVMLYDWDNELINTITTGGISYELCRPVNLYQLWFAKLLSKRLSMCVLRFSPIVIIAFIMPYPYNLSLPASPVSFLLFVITLSFGAFLLVSLSMLVYISIFKTMSPIGSFTIFGLLTEFFSGATIPIPLMPSWLQTVCMFLPLRWAADLPYRVYSGSIGIPEAIVGIGIQLIWIFILTAAGLVISKKITRLSVVQGG